MRTAKLQRLAARVVNRVARETFFRVYRLDDVRRVEEIGIDPSIGHEHAPTSDFLELALILARLPVRGRAIADFGCGSGAALALFRLFPFRKIYGIELSCELAAKASHNFRRSRRVAIHQGDAREVPLPQLDIAYFFNPFPYPVLHGVLSALLKESDRLTVVYRNPKFLDQILDDFGAAVGGVRELATFSSRYAVLEMAGRARRDGELPIGGAS